MNKGEEKPPSSRTVFGRKAVRLLIFSALAVGLLAGFSFYSFGRIEGEVETELWLKTGENTFEEKSATNIRADYLGGNLTDYPGKLATALYWPNTNNTLFDTGLALSGNLGIPLVEESSPDSKAFNLLLDGYLAKDFGPDYPIGTTGGSSRISFDREELNYWVTKGIINYGGFSYRAVALLERIKESSPAILRGVSKETILNTTDKISKEARAELNKLQKPGTDLKDISARTLEEVLEAIPTETLEEELDVDGNYGAGLKFALSGMKISGVSVELETRLGMIPTPQEMLGDDPGSGYDVFGADGRYAGYTGSGIEFEGIELGPVRLDTRSSFSAENGFEKTELDFSLEEESEIFEFEGKMTYEPDKKTVSLEPSLDLEWTCLNVYSEIRPTELTDEKNEINGLTLKGYGMEKIQLGDVQVSFLEALGDTKLKRLVGEEDWRLRSYDYELSSESEFSYAGRSFIYEKTNYDGVLSLEGGRGNLRLGLDTYWGSEDVGLLGISKITGEAEYRLSEYFDLTGGIVLDSAGLEGLILNTVYSW